MRKYSFMVFLLVSIIGFGIIYTVSMDTKERTTFAGEGPSQTGEVPTIESGSGADEGNSTFESRVFNESDMAEVIRLSLTLALVDKEIPDYRLIKDKENIVLSTENIREDLVPEIPGVNLIVLEPDEIQRKADREGNFLYLCFSKLEVQNERNAIVHLDNVWMKSSTSRHMYLSGGGLAIAYSKDSGSWKGTLLYAWIS